MSWKMLALLVSPAMGRAVSRGVLATKDLEVPKGAGLVWARKGARPVAAGPKYHEHRACRRRSYSAYRDTGRALSGNTGELLRC